jgi:predicted transglutaminase-like cysteine proteinase
MKHHQIFQNIITDRPDRDIVFIFHNDFFDRKDKYRDSYSYATELMKFTWSLTNNTLDQRFNFLVSDNLEEALVTAKLAGFKCAIIQTPGHALKHNFLETLVEERKQDWLLFGHILEQDNRLRLHDQCIILNIEKLEIDEMYPGDRDETKLMPLYNRSDENFHDEYTPTWVKFNDQYKMQKTGWGWRWLAKGLINSQILTFTKDMRNTKIHIYPENSGSYEAWYRKDNTSQMAQTIAGMSKPTERKIHIYNNETVPDHLIQQQTKQTHFDNIVVLASGFYGMKMAKAFSPSKIVYYDIMPEMLTINQSVNETWDGMSDITEYGKEFNVRAEPNQNWHDIYSEGIFKDQADVTTFLPTFKNIEKDYRHVNIITHPGLFLSMLPTTGSTYVWLNGIYTYWINLWQHRPREIEQSYQIILDGIRKHDNDIWLHLKDPNGFIRIIHNKTFDDDFSKMSFASNNRTWS